MNKEIKVKIEEILTRKQQEELIDKHNEMEQKGTIAVIIVVILIILVLVFVKN